MGSKGAAAYETLMPHGLARKSTLTVGGHGLEALQRELEQELKADKTEIGSYSWFHGPVPRNVAENLVNKEGEFLVRESTSTGEYVITCKWHSALYHFKVNTHVIQDMNGSRAQYSLEDDLFDSLYDLVNHHVKAKTAISKKSGAIISHAIPRDIPLSYTDKKYASLRRQPKRLAGSGKEIKPEKAGVLISTSLSSSPSSSISSLEDPNKSGFLRTPSPLHSANGSFASRNNQRSVKPEMRTASPYSPRTNGSPSLGDSLNKQNAAVSPQQGPVCVVSPQRNPEANMNNNNSSLTPELSRVSKVDSPKIIPPKPSRVPSFKSHARKARSLEGSPKRSPILSPPTKHTTPVKPIRHRYTRKTLNNENKRASCFKPLQYRCTMLPDSNGPLHKNAMKTVKEVLIKVDPFKLARHITVMDCKVCRVTEYELEQILLPSGKQLRRDMMERYQCTAFWVVACMVNVDASVNERVQLLNKFVQTANELVHSLGNIFGFAAVMHGLTSPQVLSMESCWASLQLSYTNNYVTFVRKLRPLLKYMDEGKGQISANSTCIPHLVPLLRLMENPHNKISHINHSNQDKENSHSRAASFGSLLEQNSLNSSKEDSSSLGSLEKDNDKKSEWWENLPNDSFDAVMSHLNSGRQLVSNSERYCKNSNIKLQDFHEVSQLREICSTDFQLRLLFGYRGADVDRKERYEKFDKILTALLRKMLS